MLEVPSIICSSLPFLDDATFSLTLLLFIQLLGSVRLAAGIKQAFADVKLNADILFITAALGHHGPPLQTWRALPALSLESLCPSAFCARSNDTHPRDVPLQSSAAKNRALTLKR